MERTTSQLKFVVASRSRTLPDQNYTARAYDVVDIGCILNLYELQKRRYKQLRVPVFGNGKSVMNYLLSEHMPNLLRT
jgi:hypothetical protein